MSAKLNERTIVALNDLTMRVEKQGSMRLANYCKANFKAFGFRNDQSMYSALSSRVKKPDSKLEFLNGYVIKRRV